MKIIFTIFFNSFLILSLQILPNNDISKITNKYNIITIDTIDFKNLILVKKSENKTHHRIVYYSPEKKQYIKIWSKDYRCVEDFINALVVGFYDEISPLKSLIFDETKQFCLGYITEKMDNKNSDILTNDKKKILDCNVQNNKYQNFFNLLKKKSNYII